MSCADNRLLHSALLDGELAPAERAQVEAHLATCADCTAELAALARTLGMLHALPTARAPLGFVDRVLEAARPMPWHRRLGRRLFQPLRVKLPLEAAAVVLVALGAVYVFQNTPELQQAARQEQPASAPVPVAPPATPAPATGPAVSGTPAPPASAPAEPSQPATKTDQVEQVEKKERESALSEEAQKKRAATLERRSDSSDASPGATSLMKDAAPAPPPAAAPPPSVSPPPIAAAPPAAAPPSEGAAAVAPPAAPAPEARDKRAARSRPQAPREVEGVRPEAKPGELSARAPQMPARLFVAPDASGRLTVGDRAAAERALAELGGRLGVAQAFRREEADGALIEWMVPREVYPEFVRGLAGIGRWTADREPATLPPRVRLQIRVGS
ncbi:MAG TPA: zf-HC2 domain-containing protein [Pseudomonadales bacterium]|nr:zf-HC2 domain-containing protein [Pseudomonadales bacterium]